jgi:hemerythrin-like domain-containing protein
MTPQRRAAEQLAVHDALRRELAALPGLLAGAAAGGVTAAAVAGRVHALTAALGRHLAGEDEVLWPLLLERATRDGALVLRMEEQHARITVLHERADAAATAFAATADRAAADRLAFRLAALAGAVEDHLREEEDAVLPLAERHLTAADWAALGRQGASGCVPGPSR